MLPTDSLNSLGSFLITNRSGDDLGNEIVCKNLKIPNEKYLSKNHEIKLTKNLEIIKNSKEKSEIQLFAIGYNLKKLWRLL